MEERREKKKCFDSLRVINPNLFASREKRREEEINAFFEKHRDKEESSDVIEGKINCRARAALETKDVQRSLSLSGTFSNIHSSSLDRNRRKKIQFAEATRREYGLEMEHYLECRPTNPKNRSGYFRCPSSIIFNAGRELSVVKNFSEKYLCEIFMNTVRMGEKTEQTDGFATLRKLRESGEEKMVGRFQKKVDEKERGMYDCLLMGPNSNIDHISMSEGVEAKYLVPRSDSIYPIYTTSNPDNFSLIQTNNVSRSMFTEVFRNSRYSKVKEGGVEQMASMVPFTSIYLTGVSVVNSRCRKIRGLEYAYRPRTLPWYSLRTMCVDLVDDKSVDKNKIKHLVSGIGLVYASSYTNTERNVPGSQFAPIEYPTKRAENVGWFIPVVRLRSGRVVSITEMEEKVRLCFALSLLMAILDGKNGEDIIRCYPWIVMQSEVMGWEMLENKVQDNSGGSKECSILPSAISLYVAIMCSRELNRSVDNVIDEEVQKMEQIIREKGKVLAGTKQIDKYFEEVLIGIEEKNVQKRKREEVILFIFCNSVVLLYNSGREEYEVGR